MAFTIITVYSCKQPSTENEVNPDNQQQTEVFFPKGEKVSEKESTGTNGNFTGEVWREILSDTLSRVGSVTFEPGARTNWHSHPGGQVLIVTAGLGYYQEKGKPIQIIRKRDVVNIPPDVEHWHGASPDSALTHIAVSINSQNEPTVWLKPVTDEEYYSNKP
ncbi:MAG: cupin domain-containing protein [Breznakibacter sp.]